MKAKIVYSPKVGRYHLALDKGFGVITVIKVKIFLSDQIFSGFHLVRAPMGGTHWRKCWIFML